MQRVFQIIKPVIVCAALTGCNSEKALRVGQEVPTSGEIELSTTIAAQKRWTIKIGGDQRDGQYSLEPAFANDTVIMANHKGEVVNVDLNNGATRWRKKVEKSLVAGVGVGDGIAVVANSEGTISALDLDSGEPRWQFVQKSGVSAVPTIAAGLVLIRTIDGGLTALKSSTGQKRWHFNKPTSSLSIGNDAPLLIAGEGVLSGYSTGQLLAANISTGQVFWEKRLFRPKGQNVISRLIDIDARPALSGASVLVSAYQGGTAALELRTGSEIWRSEHATRKTMFLTSDAVFLTENDGTITRLNLSDGTALWSQPRLRGHGVSNPVLWNGVVMAADIDGKLYALNSDSGELESNLAISKHPVNSLIVRDDNLFAYSVAAGELIALSQ